MSLSICLDEKISITFAPREGFIRFFFIYIIINMPFSKAADGHKFPILVALISCWCWCQCSAQAIYAMHVYVTSSLNIKKYNRITHLYV